MPHVFDVYGTLLDVDAAAREAAAAPGMESLAASWPQLAAAWRQRQLSYSWLRTTMQRYTDFWTITQNALDVTMAEMGIEDAAMREKLLSLYTTLTAYDEVPEVLRNLAARGEIPQHLGHLVIGCQRGIERKQLFPHGGILDAHFGHRYIQRILRNRPEIGIALHRCPQPAIAQLALAPGCSKLWPAGGK